MTLPILKINLSQLGNNMGTLGFDYIVGLLKDSGQFEIQDHSEKINPAKGFRGTILYFNGKKIYLDFWEYTAPSHSSEVINGGFDLVIKLQHKDVGIKKYLEYVRHKNFFPEINDDTLVKFYNKIVPWTFFPSKNMFPYINKEDTLFSLPIEQIGFFCGRNWKARHSMKAKMDRDGIKFISNEVPGQRISDEEFLHLMLSSKYGIVFPGRSTPITDAKNRREIDYMMMRKPMLISYNPYYYDPLINGKHFILIDDKTDLKNIDKMYNIEEITKNAYKWYQDNASPYGIVQSFLKIMKDRGYYV